MQQQNNTPQIIMKPCNARQLACSYGVSKKVLQQWLQPHQQYIGQRNGHKYSLQQLPYIIEIIGLPTQQPAAT
jgi:hypothetical protein